MAQIPGLPSSNGATCTITPIKAFADNYIWMVSNGRQALVVDPGDAAPVLAALAQHGLMLTSILLTHHHQDHVGGVAELVQATKATVYGPATEALPHCDQSLSEGDKVSISEFGLELSVLDIPGHTAGHIAYEGYVGATRLVFCGDTLFAGGCGRIFEGTPQQMHDSLSKLAALPAETRVYCTHEYTASNLRFAVAAEPDNQVLMDWQDTVTQQRANDMPTLPSTIGQELLANPFLRCDQATIAKQTSQWANTPLTTTLEVFTQLRAWKNVFR